MTIHVRSLLERKWPELRINLHSSPQRLSLEHVSPRDEVEIKNSIEQALGNCSQVKIYSLGKASDIHVPGILALQEENLIENLSLSNRQAGFLSARFTAAHLNSFVSDLGIIVALCDKQVSGYCIAKTLEVAATFRLLSLAIEKVAGTWWADSVIDSSTTVFLGPICVSIDNRGNGLMAELYRATFDSLYPKFKLGITVVSTENKLSLSLHEKKIGMTPISKFDLGSATFIVLVRSLIS